jgi:hypothetical protein
MTSLLLSSLYGVEFVKDKTVIQSFDVSFRKGLRSFLGVPSKVSNDCLSVLFPGFSFEHFVLKRKWGFLNRTLAPSDTLAAILFVEDRAVDFPEGHGFSADFLALLKVFGLPELVYCDLKADVARTLELEATKESILCWECMSRAKSTGFLCSVFGSPSQFFEAALWASTINLSALRIFLLMWTGSVAIQVFGSNERSCRFCSESLDSRHFFGCSFDTCHYLQLIVLARNGQYEKVVRFTNECYFSFLFRSKPLVLSEEELVLSVAFV